MAEAVELLRRVNIPNPEQRVKQYPFEFSGGMQQRAMIAMAMACNPDILIADEPTTALDVTVQAQVLEELNKMRQETNTALIIITHNLGVVARYADSVKIVYGGKVVEEGDPYDYFLRPPPHPPPPSAGVGAALPPQSPKRRVFIEGDPRICPRFRPTAVHFTPGAATVRRNAVPSGRNPGRSRAPPVFTGVPASTWIRPERSGRS